MAALSARPAAHTSTCEPFPTFRPERISASMTTTKRRSRMQRISSGKRIELTMRDIELFKLLYRYQYLRSDFLYAFLGGESQTRFKERLGDLYHDGRFINRPEQQWQFANCSMHAAGIRARCPG